MRSLPFLLPLAATLFTGTLQISAAPVFLENQFDLPPGFRIYKAASAELTGGSYDITFDGQGRLLVGDGKAVRRLYDENQDGVYDRHEIIARGLGGRGPQGLLVYGDRLYAVGGDGIQLFEGYESGGPLVHRGRLGAPFHTGGDHTAHTILRGHDDYLYFVTGDGGGVEGRRHITEQSSPALTERAGSVFRISPDGRYWECVASGGRNAPSLGMNYLGELFSWDSDMEWHVDLPFYRPLRLNHWVQGSDQGWQGVGAYPPYYVDTLPPVVSTGRGSPNWGVFYEHQAFPEKFNDTFFVCDYLWKSATSGQYNTSGRLVAFHLQPEGSGWKTQWETFARPRPGARDKAGRSINFALVDIAVAPDGSLYLSDHNQGVWRILYDRQANLPVGPPLVAWPTLGTDPETLLDQALKLPQQGSEWARLRLEKIQRSIGSTFQERLQARVLAQETPARSRLNALRLLIPGFKDLSDNFLQQIGRDPDPLLRGQAAWLAGLKALGQTPALILDLINDSSPWVRRRAAEAMTRTGDETAIPALIQGLRDPDRLIRYVSMIALTHRSAQQWLPSALSQPQEQVVTRALVAAHLQGNPPDSASTTLLSLLERPALSENDQLDRLRVLSLYEKSVRENPRLAQAVAEYLTTRFPSPEPRVRWEQIRLMGMFQVDGAFGPLLDALEIETDPVTRFHMAQALARFQMGWTKAQAQRLFQWFASSQNGWFANPQGKGRQFPEFWGTVLADYLQNHQDLLLEQDHSVIQPDSQWGKLVLEQSLERMTTPQPLLDLYQLQTAVSARQRILRRMGDVPDPAITRQLAEVCRNPPDARLRTIALISLAKMPLAPAHVPLLMDGLQDDDLDAALACARGLSSHPGINPQPIADAMLNQMTRHPEASPWISVALSRLPPDQPHPDWTSRRPRKPEDRPEPELFLEYWLDWYQARFQQPFQPGQTARTAFPNAEVLLDFLAGDQVKGGNSERGKALFEKAQCLQCHGGEALGGGQLFGPDLAGVTGRLNPVELAESIAFPSRQVAERYQATEVELKDGTVYTGFITQQSPDSITLATQETIKRIPRKDIDITQPQTLSLMPEGLLNGLSKEDIKDLMAFLRALGN